MKIYLHLLKGPVRKTAGRQSTILQEGKVFFDLPTGFIGKPSLGKCLLGMLLFKGQ